MGFKEQYLNNKDKLLHDNSICRANRKLFNKFFTEEEYKLKRINSLNELDKSCYKTLCTYFHRLRNVNSWFKNKKWKRLTEKEIKAVYDQLEDGKLKGISGKTIKSKVDYYNKIFKSLPFELAGKSHIAIKAMKYYGKKLDEEVTFFVEKTHREIANATDTVLQRLFCWIAWDWGENVFSNLQLQKRDFTRRLNPDTNEAEYLLFFPPEKLKRSRIKGISEINNFSETVDLLDIVLKELDDDDYLFNFGHRQASQFLDKATKKVNARCIPNGKKPTWKDFRSSMACHLLKSGWTSDEIKRRMRHSVSSKVLNKYVNYLALDSHVPKRKIDEGKISQLTEQVEDMKQREKITLKRSEVQKGEIETLKEELESLKDGRGFMNLLFNLSQKDKEKLAYNFFGKKFDVILPADQSSKSA